MMQRHLLVLVRAVTSTNVLNYISVDMLLCPGHLYGFFGQPMLLDRLSLVDLFFHFHLPFAIIAALATSITILDIAIVRSHLERIFPLIKTAHYAVSIVPAARLALQLLMRFFVHNLVLLHKFLFAFIAPVLQPQAFNTFVDVANMLGPVTS
jgi:hypothetical protein